MNRPFRHPRRLAGAAFLLLLFGLSLFVQDGPTRLLDGWVAPAWASGGSGAAPMPPGECSPGITRSHPDAAYTVNADGTITDTRTGLTWDRCAWGLSGEECAGGAASSHTWAGALDVAATANAQNHKDHADWRLPSVKELRSLVEECRADPAINDVIFPNTPFGWFWSSSPSAGNSDYAWFVDFDTGYVDAYYKNGTGRVRLVRAGQ
ncbi:MAG: DUF1566 domain-containing protein [Gammaproteobacteria bacterium]|nr:DUF1566 domain-containing protein [Gammaproteobacteria bacterium]